MCLRKQAGFGERMRQAHERLIDRSIGSAQPKVSSALIGRGRSAHTASGRIQEAQPIRHLINAAEVYTGGRTRGIGRARFRKQFATELQPFCQLVQ